MPGPMSSHLFDSFTQSSRPPFVEHMSITPLHSWENWGPEKSVTHSKPHSEWWSQNLSPDDPAWQPLYHSGSPILDNLYPWLGGMIRAREYAQSAVLTSCAVRTGSGKSSSLELNSELLLAFNTEELFVSFELSPIRCDKIGKLLYHSFMPDCLDCVAQMYSTR